MSELDELFKLNRDNQAKMQQLKEQKNLEEHKAQQAKAMESLQNDLRMLLPLLWNQKHISIKLNENGFPFGEFNVDGKVLRLQTRAIAAQNPQESGTFMVLFSDKNQEFGKVKMPPPNSFPATFQIAMLNILEQAVKQG
jgi:hypothetical protein